MSLSFSCVTTRDDGYSHDYITTINPNVVMWLSYIYIWKLYTLWHYLFLLCVDIIHIYMCVLRDISFQDGFIQPPERSAVSWNLPLVAETSLERQYFGEGAVLFETSLLVSWLNQTAVLSHPSFVELRVEVMCTLRRDRRAIDRNQASLRFIGPSNGRVNEPVWRRGV